MTGTDPHTLTGAYALDALDDDERAVFERHLAGCDSCARECADFLAAAARLALAETVTPRPDLRERVLGQVTSVRQLPPGPAAPAARLRRSARRAGGASRWALAACLAAATALGTTALWQYERAGDARARAERAERHAGDIAGITGVLAAPDARSGTARLAGGATATVVVSKSRDRAVFLASGMAGPPRGKVYQLWFEDGGVMRPAGVMDPGRASQAVLMRGAVGTASGMGITVEPEGGSPRPTSSPVATMGLPA
ncbi:anti-sigma factor [Streptomyces yaizuensis]|uniref:Regulator of SigK n=1 Tax=Streptomyces yaizuensis TaxID=2989713 RepID=A0ABQ5P9F8_9ACTN|nr:anti-sigma factor [Streptomyces sp. YSPA8]GLF99202.1 anti-sigma factor [Streptomyces sp. YSPA8]